MLTNLIASTMTVGPFSLEEGLCKLAEAGITEVELCNVGRTEDVPAHIVVKELCDKEVARLAGIVKASGLKAHCINIGGTFDLDKTEYLYALGKELRCKIITHEAGYPKEGVERGEMLKIHTELNSKYADMGEKYGIVTSIEAPHKFSLAESPEQIEEYWSMQDSRLRCTFDCAHMAFAGMDPMVQFEKYATRVSHCHIRDAIKGNSLMRYGEGNIDFSQYIPRTKLLGYHGKYSMEYMATSREDAIERLRSSIQYLSQFEI